MLYSVIIDMSICNIYKERKTFEKIIKFYSSVNVVFRISRLQELITINYTYNVPKIISVKINLKKSLNKV